MTDRNVFELLKKIDNGYEPTPNEVELLSGIEKITVGYEVRIMPTSIKYLTNLRTLEMQTASYHMGFRVAAGICQSFMDRLPPTIGELHNLRYLDLGDAPITSLPDSIGKLKNLEILILGSKKISTLPESIGHMESLKVLNLQNTRIFFLPDSIRWLSNLEELHLDRTQLESFPDSISYLTHLRILTLSNNNIGTIPESIGNLTSLVKLDLGFNRLTHLSEGICRLDNLQTLFLSHNPLCELPEGIGNLKKLITLKLDYTPNLRSPLPEEIGGLRDLQHMNLTRSGITGLPESIGNLKKLRVLVIDHSGVTSLPKSIGECASLSHVILSYSPMDDLPDSLWSLGNLVELSLTGLEIKYIPDALGNMPALKRLFIEDLRLFGLPESLLKLNLEFHVEHANPKFKSGIFLNGTILSGQPVEIFSQGRGLIAEYYKTARSPINECKVVFLGDGGAGKSLIINRLMHDGSKSGYFDGASTPGIRISSKKYQIGDDEIQLHFWDFGGQAIMHSMHRLFLTSRTLYVVVANARDNKANEQARYWIRNIESFAKGSPVLLLINQKDQNPSVNINETKLRRECPMLQGIQTLSALEDDESAFNLAVRDEICRAVSEMESVHVPFPKPWISLMEDLQDMPENYITSGSFRSKCADNGLDPVNAPLEELIGWYQDLGVCFYSKAHPASREYMVLNPRWLLNALYILAFNGRRHSKNGIISEEHIYGLICSEPGVHKVWDDIAYRPSEIQYILNVLTNYELVYMLDKKNFFIPMLCDENELEVPGMEDCDSTTHICFEYNYLPENVLHRLMVRHGRDLIPSTVWRTGVLLECKACGWRALIRINGNSLDVYASSSNPETNPINPYLDIIRASITDINETIGLVSKEWIVLRKNGMEDRFSAERIKKMKEAGKRTEFSDVFGGDVEIDALLGIVSSTKDQETQNVINYMCNTLSSMSERTAYLIHRGEPELTSDFQEAISAILNDRFGIQIAREYTAGRSLKTIGETDLYFYKQEGGEKQVLYILENKVIDGFSKQYMQLMGYLKPHFLAGITLSINKDKTWEGAFNYICKKLSDMQKNEDVFAPISIDRKTSENGTLYVKSEHIVPETGKVRSVYHLVMQLSDKERQEAAKKAR